MGIKHFFGWYKTNFGKNIQKIKKGDKLSDKDVEIDNLMIDLNGLFHSSTQKIYQYGNHKPLRRMLSNKKPKRQNGLKLQMQVFEDICKNIDTLFDIVKPKKKLILCVDGPAPLAKQAQQRQRRFRSAKEKDKEDMENFDSNSLTPGTKFMDFLTKYIDWYIRKKISEDFFERESSSRRRT
jgi:5'-3' exoribonuclease 1